MVENEYSGAILDRFQSKMFAFIDDVRRRTRIFEARRSVEEQLANEYHGRLIIELIQNADDACGPEGKIVIVIRQHPQLELVVFNTGRGFTSDNFESLCTLGLTDKKPEEAIGNKGLGFRSVLEVCDCPAIFSSNPTRAKDAQPCFDGYCFGFAPDRLRGALQKAAEHIISGQDVAKIDIDGIEFQLLETNEPDIINVLQDSLKDPQILQKTIKTLPVYEMPLPNTTRDPLLDWAGLKNLATGVFLKIRPGSEEVLKKALAELDSYTFLFLRNTHDISVYLADAEHGDPCKLIDFERNITRSPESPIKKGKVKITYCDKEAWANLCGMKLDDLRDNNQDWWFLRKTVARKEFETALGDLPERWQDIKQIEIELAVPIAPTNDLGRFAIYLPTKASTGTGAWVNAPFYGKIDRTGIDWDRKWNSSLLNQAVICVGEMFTLLARSSDIASGQAILHLLGIIDKRYKLAEAQITSELIGNIVRSVAWILSEPSSGGQTSYLKLSDLALMDDVSWKIKPVDPLMDIACRERIPIIFAHPELAGTHENIIKNTARFYDVETKKPTQAELAQLAEIAIHKVDRNKRDKEWWNGLYKWLGHLDIPYESLVGRRLIWTQAAILKVDQDSIVFSPPRRLVATEDENNPMIKRFQEILTNSLPDAFQDRVAFLHAEIDLSDKFIRSFLIRYGKTVVREFRTEQVADFILNRICPSLHREKMSKKRRSDAAEIFAWTFILWRQMRGEGLSVDWSQLIVPTNTGGWQPANETYVGRAWSGAEGADLEKVFQHAQPQKPFLMHPKNLVQMLPKTYQDIIKEFNLADDLRQFVLDALRVWTAPRLIVQKATRPGGYYPEFCPTGFFNALDTTALREVPEKFKLPIDKMAWDAYLRGIELASKDRPFQMSAKYLLGEVSYVEDINIAGIDDEALARSLGRGWRKYYCDHATTTIQRHPQDYGERRQWDVVGFVVEQLRHLKWLPLRVWATRIDEGRENSKEFKANVLPQEVLKVNKDLLETGSALIYSLLPHIAPNVEQEISEDLCRQIGTALYSPRERDVTEPFYIMQLIHRTHKQLPSGREHFLLSLWQDMFDTAVSRVAEGKWPSRKPSAALVFEIQKDGSRRLRWLDSVQEGEEEACVAWINDNDDSLSMLPPGTFVVCAGKRRTRMTDRVKLSKEILGQVSVRKLSELKSVNLFETSEEWQNPRLLNDSFPWLIQPALAVLAFGRQSSQPMSVSNPKGEFPPLALRIQSARVQYVRNLKVGLEGIDVAPGSRSIFYSSSENLFLIDGNAKLRLRDLATPLSLLFDREDFQKPAELWLMKVEEATDDGTLRGAVPMDVAIDKLGIEPNSLHELFQVIGGETQQIIRSVCPALYSITKSGSVLLSPHELNSIISKVADSGNRYDLAETAMTGILTKSGVPDAPRYSVVLRRIAQENRDPSEIAKNVFKALGIDLGDWNSAALEMGFRSQIVSHKDAIEAFNRIKQDMRWAACGFLQQNLKGTRRVGFSDRWTSYDLLAPPDSIHQSWELNSAQIEGPVIEWFRGQIADLSLDADIFGQNTSGVLEVIKEKYGALGKDPEAILNDNVKGLNSRWKRLRIVLAGMACRGSDKDALLSQLQIDENAPGKWVMEEDRLKSALCVVDASEEELYTLLCEWINTQAVSIRRQLESVKVNTLEDFIKIKRVTAEEERVGEECLRKGPIVIPRRTIGKKSIEMPEEGKPLDELRRKLDELLGDNDKEILNKLSGDVDLAACANLGDAPSAKSPRKQTGHKGHGREVKDKDSEFIGYVGEYMIYKALKNRYPHIGLSSWVSGNKQKFYPGSKGDDKLGYDFCLSVDGHKVLIEVKSHIGDKSYFDLGSTELDAAQEALENETIYQVWVVRNLDGVLDIDHIPNPMAKENRKHFRFEIGRVYYKRE